MGRSGERKSKTRSCELEMIRDLESATAQREKVPTTGRLCVPGIVENHQDTVYKEQIRRQRERGRGRDWRKGQMRFFGQFSRIDKRKTVLNLGWDGRRQIEGSKRPREATLFYCSTTTCPGSGTFGMLAGATSFNYTSFNNNRPHRLKSFFVGEVLIIDRWKATPINFINLKCWKNRQYLAQWHYTICNVLRLNTQNSFFFKLILNTK